MLRKIGITPNQWTLLSIVFAAVTFYFLMQQSFGFAAAAFALAAVFDVFDGAVARATAKATKTGAYLDTVVDRYVEFFVIAGLFLANLPPYLFSASFWLLFYLFGSTMTTYARAAAKEAMNRHIKGGILERAERMILLFVGLLLAIFSTTYLSYIIVILAALSNITALQRIGKALNK